jgi:hypothetical protein
MGDAERIGDDRAKGSPLETPRYCRRQRIFQQPLLAPPQSESAAPVSATQSTRGNARKG